MIDRLIGRGTDVGSENGIFYVCCASFAIEKSVAMDFEDEDRYFLQNFINSNELLKMMNISSNILKRHICRQSEGVAKSDPANTNSKLFLLLSNQNTYLEKTESEGEGTMNLILLLSFIGHLFISIFFQRKDC